MAKAPEELGPRARKTRKKIIDTALALIVEHGEKGVKMTDICERTGISRTTMYRHFGHLDEIVEAVYLKVRADFAKGLEDAIKANPAKEDRLDVVVNYLAEFFRGGLTQKLNLTDPAFLRKLSLRNFDSRVKLYQKILEPFFDEVDAAKGSKVDRALVAYFITHFYASLSLYGEHSQPYPVESLIRKLIRGIAYLPEE